MAKGYETHQARIMALQGMGKDLARRAKSKCELTGVSGVPLHPYEVPPVPADPDFQRTILVSETCLHALEHPNSLTGQEWRCLAETVWSNLPAAQVMAWRMLSVLATREDWARNALEEVFLDPEIEEWALAAPL
jgi:protein PhnA